MEREHSPFFSLAAFLLTHHLIKAYRAKFSSHIPLEALSPHSALPTFPAVFHPASSLCRQEKQEKSKDWLGHRESEERFCHSFRRVTIGIRAQMLFLPVVIRNAATRARSMGEAAASGSGQQSDGSMQIGSQMDPK